MKYHYAIIRYVYDIDREESVNVGVILVAPEADAVRVLTVGNTVKIVSTFGAVMLRDSGTIDVARIKALIARMKVAAERINPTEAALSELASIQAGNIRLTASVAGETDDIDATAAELFDELVG